MATVLKYPCKATVTCSSTFEMLRNQHWSLNVSSCLLLVCVHPGLQSLQISVQH